MVDTKLISVYPVDEQFLLKDKNIKSIKFNCYLSSLEQVPDLSPLTKLEKIDLSNNKISSFKGFDKLTSLEKLHDIILNNNNLRSLKGIEALQNCKKLKNLSLSDNSIEDLGNLYPLFSFENLEFLDLSKNKINELNINFNIPKLKILKLNNNEIERINSLSNLSSLEILYLQDNKLTKLENFSRLPNLHRIHVDNNHIRIISDLENMPNLQSITGIRLTDCSKKEAYDLINYIHKTGLTTSIDYEISEAGKNFYDNLFEEYFIIKGPIPRATFKVNDLITLKLIEDKTKIFIGLEEFQQCNFLLLTIPTNQIILYENIESIDEAAEIFDKSMEKIDHSVLITPETEFWGHCSNLQAWAENNYDTRLLHSNLAFPLLQHLAKEGDLVARRVFKEEIAKRFSSGFPPVQNFLKEEGYLEHLNKEELSLLLNISKRNSKL